MSDATPRLRFAPVTRYLSREIAGQESAKIWPKVWLMAGRLEQLKEVGDFLTLDIDRESIIVVRSSRTELKAFYNVCQHRGRRLKEGCGNTGKTITCGFHGWRWGIDGKAQYITNEEDFEPCAGYSRDLLGLQPVKLDTWGGWIFVSMDPDIEPLLQWLAPIPEVFEHYEFENCRIKWAITLTFPCNWKVALNAFNEQYHVEMTHSQLNKYGLAKAPGKAHGKHSQFLIDATSGSSNLGTANARFKDLVETIEYREAERDRLLSALISEYSLEASKNLRNHVTPEMTPAQIVAKYRELHRTEMEAAGARWPDQLTNQDMARAGVDWHVFPNFIFLPSIDGALYYRARPNPNNPEECWYDIWWMQRYGEGKEPEYEHKFFPTLESAAGVNPFLEQDFSNMRAVQLGMHSRGFRGAVYNPLQEIPIRNFEKVLDEYLQR